MSSAAHTPAPRAAEDVTPLGRRAVDVVRSRPVGAYGMLSVRDDAGPRPQPGQFYMLACRDGWGAGEDQRPFLPRACSVARVRKEPAAGHLEFLLEDVGPGTRRLLAASPGEQLWLTGPLGVGFGLPAPGGRSLLVGGGAGMAPLIIWQDRLRRLGRPAKALLGFRSARHAEAAALLTDARVATDDGSVGHWGPVTQLLSAELEDPLPTSVYACGPPAMLDAVRGLCGDRGVGAQLALEAPMACGYGACFGCVIATREGYARVCVDGPVFAAERLEGLLAGHD